MRFAFWKKPKRPRTTEELLDAIESAVAEMDQRTTEVEKHLQKAVKHIADIRETLEEFKSQNRNIFEDYPTAERLVNQLSDETVRGMRGAMPIIDEYFKILSGMLEIQSAAHEKFPD
jgi:septal ring factor EnvC (AmiA/AmiB activator)